MTLEEKDIYITTYHLEGFETEKIIIQEFGNDDGEQLKQQILTALQIKQRVENKIQYLKSIEDHQVTNGETDISKYIHLLEKLVSG